MLQIVLIRKGEVRTLRTGSILMNTPIINDRAFLPNVSLTSFELTKPNFDIVNFMILNWF